MSNLHLFAPGVAHSRCALVVAFLWVALSDCVASAQSPTATDKPVEFEVVSIKPAHGDAWSAIFTEDGFDAESAPLQYLLRVAFAPAIAPPDILGKPRWADEIYDIHAKVAAEDVAAYKQLAREQKLRMLQKILADRFQLRYHLGTTTHSVYDLVASSADPQHKRLGTVNQQGPGSNAVIMMDGMLRFRAHPENITYLARRLSWIEDVEHKAVVDQTGLTGFYNFDLAWCPTQDRATADAPTCNGSSLFTAVREQLGLQLKPAEQSFPTMIIDKIERPSPN
jgi:uncharacterized protein (TIGR03435 family)